MKALFEDLSTRKRDVALLNLAMLVVILVFWATLSGRWEQDQNYDYLTYYGPVAQRLVDGVGLWEPSGAVAAHYPPGFSILLAGVYEIADLTGIGEETALKLFILMCSALSVTLLYAIAVRIFGERVALLAGLLWATYPFFLWLSKQPNSETPFLVLFLATIYSFIAFWPGTVRPEWPSIRTGLLAGLTSLVRPAAVLLSVVLAVVLLYVRRDLQTKRRLRAAVLLLFGNLLAVMPWEVWVWQQSGQWILLGRSSKVSLVEGMNFALRPQGSGIPLQVDPKIRDLMAKADAHQERIDTLGGVMRFLLEEARTDPVTVGRFLLFKGRRAWYGTQAQWLENWTAVIQAGYLSVILAGAIFALRRRDGRRNYALLSILCAAYFWAMTLIVVPLLRYMVPV
ncbi:MAG: ArnT family glycosyltransferase, partial [Candidatus Dormibacteraceae bacterium]